MNKKVLLKSFGISLLIFLGVVGLVALIGFAPIFVLLSATSASVFFMIWLEVHNTAKRKQGYITPQEAQEVLEYARSHREKTPNKETQQAMDDVRNGNVHKAESIEKLMKEIDPE